MPISFKEYIRKASITNSSVGDFVAVLKRDPGTAEIQSLEQLQTHVAMHSPPQPLDSVVYAVWRNYKGFLRRRR